MSEKTIPDLMKEVSPGFGIEGPLGGQYLNFDGDRIWSFNGEIGCMVDAPKAISDLQLLGAVDGKRLAYFASRAPKPGSIKFRLKNEDGVDYLFANSGNASVRLKWIAEAHTLPYAIPKRWKDVPKNFAKAISSTALSCASHITRPWLTCVHVADEFVESSDGMRIMRYDLDATIKGMNTLVPRNVAFHLGSTGVKRIWPEKDHTWFETDSGARIFCPMVAGIEQFPDLDRFLATDDKETIEFSLPFEVEARKGIVTKLQDSLDRARAFGTEEEEAPRVSLQVENNNMLILAEDSVGRYKEEISLKGVPDLSVRLHVQHLLDLVDQGRVVACKLEEGKMIWMCTEQWEFVSVVEAPKQ